MDPDAKLKAISCDDVQAIRDSYLINEGTPEQRARCHQPGVRASHAPRRPAAPHQQALVAVSRRAGSVLAIAALVAASLFATAPSAHARRSAVRTYGPPYAAGPSGGDEWNYISADGDDRTGQRVPVLPAAGVHRSCGGAGGFANLQLVHRVQGSMGRVTRRVRGLRVGRPTRSSRVLVRTASGRWLGAKKVRGPAADAGTIEVPIVGGRPKPGTRV